MKRDYAAQVAMRRPKMFKPDSAVREHQERVAGVLADLEAQYEVVKRDNPFWFFEPSRGKIDEDGRNFMKEFLKPDDIPVGDLVGQEDFFRCCAGIRGVSGGNRAGKSVSGAVEVYIFLTGELPFSMRDWYPKEKLSAKKYKKVRVVGIDHPTLLNTVIPTYREWCPKEYLKNRSWEDSFSSAQNTLYLYSSNGTGSRIGDIEFKTNQQEVESFQGPTLDMVVYDEEPRQDIHKENLMRFLTAERLNVVFAFTPTNGLTWTYDLFQSTEVNGTEVSLFKLCSLTNKMANLRVLRDVLKGLGSYEEVKMRILGEFISLSGLVYGGLFNQKLHVIEPFERKEGDYLTIVGIDPHTVTPTAMVFLLVDRERNYYVDRCYFKGGDTSEVKRDFWDIVRGNGYRIGWTVTDCSANTSFVAFGGKNIYQEISRGENAIPAMRTSEKYTGSVKAGVDEIKKLLKLNEFSKRPRLYIVNRPENKDLIQSFKTLERDTYANEDKNGLKDRIKEGKHHHHSALRFIFQFPVNWFETHMKAPEPVFQDATVCW